MSRFLLLDLVLEKVCLNLEVGKLLAQALRLDAEFFSLLLSNLDLLLHHNTSFDGLVELGLHILERRGGVTRLPFVVIVGDLGIPDAQLKRSV